MAKILVELTDKNGKVIGKKERYELHYNPVAMHRAISVVIYSPDRKKMLLQKRAKDKPTWPMFWSNAVCTHPLVHESYEDAAHRRLNEEMGFDTSLREVFRFTYSAEFDEYWGENEYDVVFTGVYDGKIKANPEEADDFKWMEVTELKEDVEKNPDIYTPWFKKILKKL